VQRLQTLFVCGQTFECPNDRICEQHEHVCGRRETREGLGAAFLAAGLGVLSADVESEDEATGWLVSSVFAGNFAGSGRRQDDAFPILAAGG